MKSANISVRVNIDLINQLKERNLSVDFRQAVEEAIKEKLVSEETMVSELQTKLGSIDKERDLVAKKLEELKATVQVKQELKETKEQQALDDERLLEEYRNLKEGMPDDFEELYMLHKEKYRDVVTSVDELVKAKFFVPLLKGRIK